MVPVGKMMRISGLLLVRTTENRNRVRGLCSGGRAVDMDQQPLGERAAFTEDREFALEGNLVKEAALLPPQPSAESASCDGAMVVEDLDEDDDDLVMFLQPGSGPAQREAQPQLPKAGFVPQPPTGAAPPDVLHDWLSRWTWFSSRLAVEHRDAQTHVAGLSCHQLCAQHDPSYTIGASGARTRRIRRVFAAERIAPQPESQRAATGFAGLKERFRLRNREKCCGLFGKLINESHADRDQRVLKREQKHENYTFGERLMYSSVAPAVNAVRWVLCAAFVGLLAAAIVLSFHVKSAGIPFTMLRHTGPATAFARAGAFFPRQRHCDYCSGYYRPQDEFRAIRPSEVEVCFGTADDSDPRWSDVQMNFYEDSCGLCLGNNSCIDCAGQPSGRSYILSCGVCGLPEHEDSLCRCRSTGSCSWCDLNRGTVNMSGPSCSVDCTDKCGSHGTCDAFTGACTCHDDDVRGHWTGASCGYCSNAYLPDEGCTTMCSRHTQTQVCSCNVTSGQCTGCRGGYGGYNCAEPLFLCHNGGVLEADGSGCTCTAGFSDCSVAPCARGDTCRFSSLCSFRGVWYADESVSAVRGCACRGNWHGPSCNLCLCENGGKCKPDGQCACPGAFVGDQCQHCASTCSLHGSCPSVVPRMLPMRSCVALLCPNGTAMCSACQPPQIIGGAFQQCSLFTSPSECLARDHCYWLPTQNTCVVNDDPLIDPSLKCRCNGAWVGPACETCGGPNGSTCLASGSVVACDGKTYQDASQAPAMDVCGECGGYGLCVGCDGVLHSSKRLDLCGVCGGDDGCLGAAQSTPVGVTFVVDCTAHSATDRTVKSALYALQDVCLELMRASARGAILPGARCFARDFVTWATSAAGVASLAGGLWTVGDVYSFARARGRLGEVGFDVNSADATALTFMTTDVKLPVLTTAANGAKYAAYESMVDVAARAQVALKDAPMHVLQTSDSWANAVAFHISLRSVRFTSCLGIGATFALVSISFGSLRLGVLCALVTTFVLCGTLAVAFTQGWDLDAVMQICVAVVIAVACEHVVHLVDGYQDFLQSTQSHMFAVQTSRFHAFRGALLRTGLSVLTSTVAMVCVAAIFLPSAIQPFRRAAQVIVTVHLLALVSVFLFGACLCILGPLKLFRHWTVSLIMCTGLGIVGSVSLLVIFLNGGITGPSGSRVI